MTVQPNPEFVALNGLEASEMIRVMRLTRNQLLDIAHVAVQSLKVEGMIRVPCSGTCDEMTQKEVEAIDWSKISPADFTGDGESS